MNKQLLDSLTNEYPENPRIQNLKLSDSSEFSTIERDIAIDFFLGRMEYSMWESSKFSGVLNGLDPKTIGAIHSFYSTLQTDFGYSEKDYHSSLLEGFNEMGDLNKIMDATFKLEQVYNVKSMLLDSNYENTLATLEKFITK